MAIIRTAKGTAQSKSAGTTLTISSVALNEGDLLIVGICFESDAAFTDIKWGNRKLKPVKGTVFTQGDTRTRMFRAKIGVNDTRNIVATWAGTMSARVMIASSITGAIALDVSGGQGQASGTALDTTDVGTSTVADTISIALFGTAAPSGDTPGTAGSGHTLGQRIGTTGGGAATNVTLQETYEILNSTGTIQATLTLSTARLSANSIAAFAPTLDNRVGITTTDLDDVRRIFAEKTTPIDFESMSFYWNDDQNRWEAYDRGADINAADTLIAFQDGGWTEI